MALNINGGLNLTTGSIFQSDKIIRSSVQWSSSLSFIGNAQNIPIQGVPTSVTSSTVTLDTADSTYDRFDLIIVSASYFNSSSESSIGTLEKITGTASADPQYPTYNSITQVPLKYVKVKANAIVPSTAGTNPQDVPEDSEFRNVLVYNENVGVDGSPKEWNHLDPSEKYGIFNSFDGSNGTAVDPSVHNSYESTDYAQSGTKSIKFSLKPDDELYIGSRFVGGNGYYGDRWYFGHRPIVFQYFQSDGNLYTHNLLSGISFWVKLEKDLRLFGARIKIQIGNQPIGQNNGNIYPGHQTFTFEELGIERDNTEWQRVIIDLSNMHFGTRIAGDGGIVRDLLIQASINGALPVTDDWYIYFDNIQLHFGSLPSDDSPDDTIGTSDGDTGTGGNTGGGSNVYKEGSGPTTIRPTAGTHKVGALSYSSTIGGGNDNTITGSRYTYIGAGYSNIITGSDYSSLLGGRSNKVQADYSSILGGQSNCVTHDRSFIIGSNLTSDKACYTFMNNLDVAGVVSGSTFSGSFVGDGSGLTNIPTSSIVNFPTEVSRSAAAAGFGSGGGGADSNWYDGTTYISSSVEIRVDGTISGSSNIIIGSGHTDNGSNSTLVGGSNNTVCSNTSAGIILGGGSNCLSGSSSIIIGGIYNQLLSSASLIGGGSYNYIKPTDGGLASAYSTIVGGLCNKIFSPGRGTDNEVIYGQFIGGGIQNRIHTTLGNGGEYNSILGGRANSISGSNLGCAFIGGGNANSISGSSALSAILGGQSNCILDHEKTFIIGSNLTSDKACYTFMNNLDVEGTVSASIFSGSFVGDGSGLTNISGGGGNSITVQDNGTPLTTDLSLLNFVGATVTEPTADNVTVTIGSGLYEAGTGACSIKPTIGSNTVAALTSSIAGGELNNISCVDANSSHNFIGGGRNNCISGSFAGVIVGGGYNTLTTGSSNTIQIYDFIGGGNQNIAGGGFSSVVGGQNNEATGCVSGVFGGSGNKALSCRSTVMGGLCNIVNGSTNSAILGGNDNSVYTTYTGDGMGEFILGGKGNVISGPDARCSTIIGGRNNTITHRNSHIIGGTSFVSQEERTTYVENLHVTSSVDAANTISSILTLNRRETSPDSPLEGMIMASGSAGSSKLYYYDGNSWNALF